jgi:poly-gamma-glutamate capsule biosynthesis protein CapA/YwtB (metallophosphatase superfamily)
MSRDAAREAAALDARIASRPPAPRVATVPRGTGRSVLRLRAVGDVMMGSDYAPPELPPDDGASILTAVTPWLTDADLTFANLEGPLCDSGTTEKCLPSESCYAFRTPTRYGQYLKKAGIDLVSTANNHAVDFGEACRTETERTLAGLGIAFSGRPGTVAYREFGGRRVGMIGFHTSDSGHPVNDHAAAARLVREVDAQADLVIVSFHGGAEGSKALHVPEGTEMFLGENRGNLRAFSRAVVAAGADVVIGHGPHVPRGMEVIDGHLVAYSLGNFATYAKFNLKGHLATSLVLEVELAEDGTLVAGKILPVRQHGRGVPAPDADSVAIGLIRDLSWADFGDAAVRVGDDGTFNRP